MDINRVLIKGYARVGKTGITERFVFRSFHPEYKKTLGPEFVHYYYGNKKCQLWDFPDEVSLEEPSYFVKDVSVVLYCVDVSVPFTSTLQLELDNISKTYPKATLILVATKCDKHKISLSSLAQLAYKNNCPYVETSSLTGLGMEQLREAIDIAYQKSITNKENSTNTLDKREDFKKILNNLVTNINSGVNRNTSGRNSHKVILLEAELEKISNPNHPFDEAQVKADIQKICNIRRHFWNLFKPHSVHEFKEELAKIDAPALG